MCGERERAPEWAIPVEFVCLGGREKEAGIEINL